MLKFTVTSEFHSQSLLAFLKEKCKETSAKKIKKAIDSKLCKVNGKVELFASHLLRTGDLVEVNFIEEVSCFKLQVLFEDKDFIVLNKPAGLVCTNELFQKQLGPKSINWKLIHRLDKETSGLIILSKNPSAEKAALALFSERQIEKIYLALIDGLIKGSSGIIDNYLGKKGGYEGQTLYGEVKKEKGERAITHWRSLKKGEKASLVLCDLKTGRTHQIRVHFSEKGHPILGDHQYAKKPFICELKPQRHLLHAWKVCFIHPFTQKKIELEAPIPWDFQEALKIFDSLK